MPNQPTSVYTVVRELLTENIDLSNDDAVAGVKERGVTKSDADIRKVVNKTRSEMRVRAKTAKPARVPSPRSPYTLAREFLTADPGLSNDAVLALIKARGVTKSDSSIRDAIRNTRSHIKTANAALPAAPVAPAAVVSAAPQALTAPVAPAAPAAAPASSALAGEAELLAVVGRVNKTAQLCGGVAQARAIADAIRSCGGIDTFLRRLDLIADILGSNAQL